jgi:glycosyltransferase involved in cell wall biosynthesis
MSLAAVWSQIERFDVVHAHLEGAALPMARHAPVPVVTTFHGRIDRPGTYELLAGFPDVPLIAISASQRRWHPALDWVATIPHGLPLAEMPWRPTPGPYLAVVGRAAPEKGIAEAIDLAKQSGLPLRIIAKAHDPRERAMVEELILPAAAHGVEFLGEVGPDIRDPLLAGARATLMLGAWPEPFGLVAIESLGAGTPVIARRAGALPEIIEHGVDGFLVDDLQEATLAVRLAEGLDRRRIRERALERFSVERMVAAYERVYRDLVAARRPSPLASIPVSADGAIDGHGARIASAARR